MANIIRRHKLCLTFVLLTTTAWARAALAQGLPPAGVAVESAAKNGAAALAGVQAGDILLRWERRNAAGETVAHGELRSPFDIFPIERTQSPLGSVILTGRRAAEEKTFTLSSLELRIDARPVFGDDELSKYRRATEAVASADASEGVRLWRERVSASGSDRTQTAWLLMKLGQACGARKLWPEAHKAFAEAFEAAPDPSAQLAILHAHGRALEREPALEKAAEVYRRALEITRQRDGDGLMAAAFLSELGNVAYYGSHYEDAVRFYRESLAIRERLAPGSFVVAVTLNNTANARAELGDHAGAETLYRQAFEVQHRLTPDGPRIPGHLMNLAIELRIRGDLAESQATLERARAIEERYAPAEGSPILADILHSLGRVAYEQRDLERAQQLFAESLAVQERVDPEGPAVAMRLDSLGAVAKALGNLDGAERHLRRALDRARKLNPEGQEVVHTLTNLGVLEHKRGRPEPAEEMLREALRFQEKRAPHDLHAAPPLEALGDLFLEAGRLDEAGAVYERVFEIHRRLAPGSGPHASALARRGRLARRRGDAAEALRLNLEALQVLDEQSARLGGGLEKHLTFGREFDGLYRDTIDVLLQQGRAGEALHVLERSRARSFVALLGERDLVDTDIPPELEARRRRLDAEYDRTQASLARLDPAKHGEAIERLKGVSRDVRDAQAEVAREIRRASPRFASLRHPSALDLAGVRTTLDSGTVLLSYSVADDRTDLFVLSREDSLTSHRIPEGRAGLEAKVRAFRERITRARVGEVSALESEAAGLYDLLLAPVQKEIAAATRVVICPDGPLHTLPFAALRHRGRYVVEDKPLHVVVSATVYAELRRDRGPRPRGSLVAFGDPRYPLPASTGTAEAVRDASLRDGLRGGLLLTALPESRREVETIARIYGKDARVFVGEDATEEAAKSRTREARHVHFACHGLLDERVPLNSGLDLTPRLAPKDGEDNGLLQAWEIFERVRLDADLVTLSACDSGLGREMGGEGLIGLTRAFQYAGARSVLASLWAAPDRSTAELMRSFYEGLGRGLSKDEALRQAQITAIRTPGVRSRPLRWAGFQLFGDWN